jgi:hypothetical protein
MCRAGTCRRRRRRRRSRGTGGSLGRQGRGGDIECVVVAGEGSAASWAGSTSARLEAPSSSGTAAPWAGAADVGRGGGQRSAVAAAPSRRHFLLLLLFGLLNRRGERASPARSGSWGARQSWRRVAASSAGGGGMARCGAAEPVVLARQAARAGRATVCRLPGWRDQRLGAPASRHGCVSAPGCRPGVWVIQACRTLTGCSVWRGRVRSCGGWRQWRWRPPGEGSVACDGRRG